MLRSLSSKSARIRIASLSPTSVRISFTSLYLISDESPAFLFSHPMRLESFVEVTVLLAKRMPLLILLLGCDPDAIAQQERSRRAGEQVE
mmetsp:Transcript_3512/g.7942  ORF Transcript_3512/g.7942 Transcript_3512/m.7942 type:complete len:90 (-) Transcript_3512:43-312(-)